MVGCFWVYFNPFLLFEMLDSSIETLCDKNKNGSKTLFVRKKVLNGSGGSSQSNNDAHVLDTACLGQNTLFKINWSTFCKIAK